MTQSLSYSLSGLLCVDYLLTLSCFYIPRTGVTSDFYGKRVWSMNTFRLYFLYVSFGFHYDQRCYIKKQPFKVGFMYQGRFPFSGSWYKGCRSRHQVVRK